jgi:hypothetical protein
MPLERAGRSAGAEATHVEPEKKRFNFAGSHLRSWQSLCDELDKCVLLCRNCRSEIAAGAAKVPEPLAEEIRARTERTFRRAHGAGRTPSALVALDFHAR